MKKTNTKKGFTIIELVIVIAVIGILAAVLIPTFSNVIEKANESAAMQAARNEYEVFLAEHAAELTGKENYVIVYNTYAFKVTNGQFDATPAAKKAEDTIPNHGTVDLTQIKGVKYTASVTDTLYKLDGSTVDTKVEGTLYYKVDAEAEIGNKDVKIYVAA